MEEKLDRIIELLEIIANEGSIKERPKKEGRKQLMYDYIISHNNPPSMIRSNLRTDGGVSLRDRLGNTTVQEFYNSTKIALTERYKGVFGKATINDLLISIRSDFQ